jgi:hypothetical protein
MAKIELEGMQELIDKVNKLEAVEQRSKRRHWIRLEPWSKVAWKRRRRDQS